MDPLLGGRDEKELIGKKSISGDADGARRLRNTNGRTKACERWKRNTGAFEKRKSEFPIIILILKVLMQLYNG